MSHHAIFVPTRYAYAMQARPVLAVTRPLQHPWVDQAGGVTFPSLLSWLPAQSTLLAVVAEALSELQPFQQPTAQRLSPPVPQSNGAAPDGSSSSV